jgi:hypothetical protein
MSSRMVVSGKSGPYNLPVSGFTVSGDAEPYGEPIVFAQNMKNRVGSNAFPGPINGPHLSSRTLRQDDFADTARQDGPIFYIRATGERVADDKNVVSLRVECAPSFVGDGYLPKRGSRFKREGWNDVSFLLDERGIIEHHEWQRVNPNRRCSSRARGLEIVCILNNTIRLRAK